MNATWPEDKLPLPGQGLAPIRQRLDKEFPTLLQRLQLPESLIPLLAQLYLPLAGWLATQVRKDRPLLVGINGAQGSGKSTLCQILKFLLQSGFTLESCVLSIDDLYLTHAERQQLAQQVHPLLATRGVPGTHDVALGLDLFDRLMAATASASTPVPRFDKACDDRSPLGEWDQVQGRPDLILFEGWCVGARPQPEQDLPEPANDLERQEDADGSWRSYVNRQLAGPYRVLFERLDLLLMLQIPDWQQVFLWRRKQEQQLIARNPDAARTMDDADLFRFVMHYERLTRHQLAEMPQRADLVLKLNRDQEIEQVRLK